MATRHARARCRALAPGAEDLEARRLMAARVTGIDIDGDEYVLTLIGPGDLSVVNQPNADGSLVGLDEPGLIREIRFAGTLPLSSRLVGEVEQGPDGDGKVAFESLNQFGGIALDTPGSNGIFSIDMPDFILADTSPNSTESIVEPRAFINLPDGVVTLRFGGADVTTTFAGDGSTLTGNDRDDFLEINLGLPKAVGTSVIVDQIVSDGDDNEQDGVIFNVNGRLNGFQANRIVGNAEFPTNGFDPANQQGTFINSIPTPAGTTPGQIGFIRIGEDATNLGISTTTRITNLFIGGETNNVTLVAPDAARDLDFGRGMDTVVIVAGEIESIDANRGAVNSSVISEGPISRAIFGGDVIQSRFLSGYDDGLNPANLAAGPDPVAQLGGSMIAAVGGDVIDSIFASSFDPGIFQFGAMGAPIETFDSESAITLPGGEIDLKIEGEINNFMMNPLQPQTAAFAERARVEFGPVIQTIVPEPPFERATIPARTRGLIDPFTPRPEARERIVNLINFRNAGSSTTPFPDSEE